MVILGQSYGLLSDVLVAIEFWLAKKVLLKLQGSRAVTVNQ
jgi:hypothetical protein